MSEKRIAREIDIINRLGHHLNEQSVIMAMEEDAQFEKYINKLWSLLEHEQDKLSRELKH